MEIERFDGRDVPKIIRDNREIVVGLFAIRDDDDSWHLSITTADGEVLAYPGDWITLDDQKVFTVVEGPTGVEP